VPTVEKRVACKGTDIWIVFTGVTKYTRSEQSALLHDKVVGLKGGITTSKDGDVDLLSMWLHLYHSNIESDIRRHNDESFRKRAGWKQFTQHEWIVFIGIIYAARHYNQQGKGPWTSKATRVRESGKHLILSAS
jgi:hypothetical protein